MAVSVGTHISQDFSFHSPLEVMTSTGVWILVQVRDGLFLLFFSGKKP